MPIQVKNDRNRNDARAASTTMIIAITMRSGPARFRKLEITHTKASNEISWLTISLIDPKRTTPSLHAGSAASQ